jgi:hippurate hydrolase
MPEDRMPTVEIEQPSADATFNTDELAGGLENLFARHFGKERVVEPQPVMAAEDFSRYWLADKSKQSVIFWVGGVPQAKWDAVKGDTLKLPALHSSLWAPDADAVISTATEAMTVAALDILKK